MKLSLSEFIQLYKDFPGEVTDAKFAEHLNDLGYRTNYGTKFNDKSVAKKRIDHNIKSKAPKGIYADKPFSSFKKEAKKLGIDTKGLTNEEIKNKVRNRRGTLVKKERILTDPEYAAKKAKASADWAKANPEKVEASQYAYNQRRYLEKGIPPPVKTPKEALWRDLFVTAQNQKVDNRLKLTKKFGKYISLKDFLDAKITDNKTGKTITFKNLEQYINPKNTGFTYKDVITPYEQKIFINRTPGLRTELNSKLIKNWNAGDKRNFFEIQHTAGRYNDPFNVHLSNKDVNLKESQVRTKFEKMWKNSKNLSEKKKSFQLYKESLPAGIASQPSMITRTREFGERVPLDEMLRKTKTKGVNLPRGILKKVSDPSTITSFFDDVRTDALAGGQICSLVRAKGATGGTLTCVDAVEEAIQKEPEKLAQKASRLEKFKNSATGFLNFAKKGGKFGAIAAAGAATAGLVKTFMNDDPTTYLSNEDQQKNMLISMITNPIDETPEESPEILDYQLPTLGAVTAAGMVPGGKRLYDVRRRGGPNLKPAGPVRSALGLKGVLGKGLAATATPLGLLALEPLHIAGQVQSGDSLTDIATNPLNYLGPTFASGLTKEATRFAGPMASKIMRMGMSPTALKGLSRFGGVGLAASLGIQGVMKYDDWRNKRGWFSEE